MEVYLDNAATTKPSPAVLESIIDILNNYGNPSSLHLKGFLAEQAMIQVQKQIGAMLQMPYEKVVFTSGGTEANNLAILGLARSSRKRHILTTVIEHASVTAVMDQLKKEGFTIEYIPLLQDGTVKIEALEKMIGPDTLMLSLAHVNSELGTIQNIGAIGNILKDKDIYFHVDAVQSFGKFPIDCNKWGVDLISISAHKIHGMKGAGALAMGPKVYNIQSGLFGGGQQRNIRSGTENTPGILAFGKAIEETEKAMAENRQAVTKLQHLLLAGIEEMAAVHVLGNGQNPYILYLGVEGVRGEVLLHALEEKNIFVSTGSACHSKKKETSHVLRSLGYARQLIDGAIRISFSRYNTEGEINLFLAGLSEALQVLKIHSYEKKKRK